MSTSLEGTRAKVTRAIRGAAVFAVLLAGVAHADQRVEARRHFKAGMALIADGKFDAGIAELLEAYSIKPHPNVLFNVARAHESAGRVVDAVAYYRRYLDTDPPDAPKVRETLAKLEPLLPKKEPVIEPEPRPAPKVVTPAVDEATVARLTALAERLERAVEKAERAPEQPSPAEEALGPVTGAPEPEDFALPYEETVVAASRRAQTTREAPNSITVITADEIAMSGLRDIPDIIRRVPGAEVMTMGYSSANVSFRGFNQRIANKVLVLIDGRPEYQDFLGITMWPVIPIGVEEIERIEVIRGPAGALYGANAMMGVINIITRAPGTGRRAELSGIGGTGNLAEGSFVASGGEAVRFRASAGYGQSDKFSRDYAPDRADVASNQAEPTLGYRSARANLTAHYPFSKDVSVSASGGVNRLYTEIYALGLLRNFYFDGVGGYAKADVSIGPAKLRFFWNHVSSDAGPQYEPVGQRSLVTSLDANVFDGELLFQRAFELGGTHLLGAGISGRVKRVKWGYLGALQQEVHAAAFIQDEWRVLKPLSLVASYRVDRHPLLDKGQPGYAHSPRVSAVVTPFEAHSFRASFATAFREPTFLESYMDLRVPVPGITGASVLTQGSRELRPEQLISFELGYRGEEARLGLSWDVAAYWNVVSDLIVLSAVNPLPAAQAFDPASGSYLLGRSLFINDPATYTARGGEVGVTWNATTGLDLRASAALQQVVPNGTLAVCGPCTQAPALKLNAGFTYRTPVHLDLSADATYASPTTWVEREPSAADPTQIVNLQNFLGGYTVLNARVAWRFLEDRVSLAVVATHLGPNHQEHPFGNNISRRLFAELRVTP